MSMLSFIPSPAIEGKYRIVNTHMPILHSRIGLIDFRAITLEQAEKLVAAGTRYLELIPEKKKKST